MRDKSFTGLNKWLLEFKLFIDKDLSTKISNSLTHLSMEIIVSLFVISVLQKKLDQEKSWHLVVEHLQPGPQKLQQEKIAINTNQLIGGQLVLLFIRWCIKNLLLMQF